MLTANTNFILLYMVVLYTMKIDIRNERNCWTDKIRYEVVEETLLMCLNKSVSLVIYYSDFFPIYWLWSIFWTLHSNLVCVYKTFWNIGSSKVVNNPEVNLYCTM